jgi:hypothetical protein
MQYNHISYIYFEIVPSCKYTILPTTVKVLETFLKDNFWKPFQLYRSIINDVSGTTKASSLLC